MKNDSRSNEREHIPLNDVKPGGSRRATKSHTDGRNRTEGGAAENFESEDAVEILRDLPEESTKCNGIARTGDNTVSTILSSNSINSAAAVRQPLLQDSEEDASPTPICHSEEGSPTPVCHSDGGSPIELLEEESPTPKEASEDGVVTSNEQTSDGKRVKCTDL